MYKCNECGSRFETPNYMGICWESYFGVSSMFPDRHYGVVEECPECGSSDIWETYEGDEDDDDE